MCIYGVLLMCTCDAQPFEAEVGNIPHLPDSVIAYIS